MARPTAITSDITSGVGAWSIPVVFDVESSGVPFPLGHYHSTEEDVVVYVGADGYLHRAPYDCVTVVRVDVPKLG